MLQSQSGSVSVRVGEKGEGWLTQTCLFVLFSKIYAVYISQTLNNSFKLIHEGQMSCYSWQGTVIPF